MATKNNKGLIAVIVVACCLVAVGTIAFFAYYFVIGGSILGSVESNPNCSDKRYVMYSYDEGSKKPATNYDVKIDFCGNTTLLVSTNKGKGYTDKQEGKLSPEQAQQLYADASKLEPKIDPASSSCNNKKLSYRDSAGKTFTIIAHCNPNPGLDQIESRINSLFNIQTKLREVNEKAQ